MNSRCYPGRVPTAPRAGPRADRAPTAHADPARRTHALTPRAPGVPYKAANISPFRVEPRHADPESRVAGPEPRVASYRRPSIGCTTRAMRWRVSRVAFRPSPVRPRRAAAASRPRQAASRPRSGPEGCGTWVDPGSAGAPEWRGAAAPSAVGARREPPPAALT